MDSSGGSEDPGDECMGYCDGLERTGDECMGYCEGMERAGDECTCYCEGLERAGDECMGYCEGLERAKFLQLFCTAGARPDRIQRHKALSFIQQTLRQNLKL